MSLDYGKHISKDDETNKQKGFWITPKLWQVSWSATLSWWILVENWQKKPNIKIELAVLLQVFYFMHGFAASLMDMYNKL